MATDLLNNLNSSNKAMITSCINDAKDNKIEIDNISTEIICEGYLITEDNLLFKYQDVLSQYLEDYELKYEHYFLPQAVSLEVYGTTDLWYVLLFFNEMTTVHEFNKKKIKVLSIAGIYKLNKIIEIEKYRTSSNKENPPISEDITLKKVII